jgi:hypothetical protein
MLNKKALAASVSAPPKVFVEDVFSTYLYTGNSSTQTIANGIDLAGEGGLVWIKRRNVDERHAIFDSERSLNSVLATNETAAPRTRTGWMSSFNSNGFTLNTNDTEVNNSSDTYASWTFREQSKFFDVVTYTGTGSARTVAHNLGSVPGMIIVKRTDTTGDWQVYHRANTANPETDYLVLNSTAATADSDTRWNDTQPTSSVFSLGTEATVNASGGTYVAYLFAHNAGGFGPTGTDNVISCGSYTGNGSDAGPEINLGYEPQWLLIKGANLSVDAPWFLYDNMRGIATNGNDAMLSAESSNAEFAGQDRFDLTSTGFRPTTGASNVNESGKTFIYMAIRRPMKVPTTGTSVFAPFNTSVSSNPLLFNTNFPVDFVLTRKSNGEDPQFATTRLTGGLDLATNSTRAESAAPAYFQFDSNTNMSSTYFSTGFGTVQSMDAFRRAPGFMDVVCYTGTGSTGQVINHNLSVVPEMVIIKRRDGTSEWFVYQTGLSLGNSIFLNRNYAQGNDGGAAFSLSSTTITFDRTYVDILNNSGGTYVAYLFATLAGVSKVGSYTGNGSNQTINCGFTAGARFVLIKRTDSTGDWCVFDTARGIVSGNDPFLQLNSTAAEVTGEDAVDPANSGFIVNETTEALNTNAATYIFLAIA